MDLKTLKTFQRIVAHGSFQRAAEELNYAQSTVTMQIQKLEADLGVQLIERGRKFQLTEAGKFFFEQSVGIVKDLEHLQTSLADFQLGEVGTIRLGVTEPAASFRLPGLCKRFEAQYPHIRIAIEIASTQSLSERILRGEIDFALCSAPELEKDLYFEPLFKEAFVVLLPERHPLAQKSSLVPEDIRGHRLLITAATCPYRRKLEILLQETGKKPLDTMEIGSMTALKYYVQSGLGVALVPEIVLNPFPEGTTVMKMNSAGIDMTCGLLSKASEYPLKLTSAKLYQFLQQELIQEPYSY
ncbi:LysR family transcriptional regulator [Paenibacillus sp. SYP-B3998]|uniref:LysR family transcriptional regulator n=1 Tax=Paenibacillus sp. SYP-B3998 TaxID=2678564 RepID=A0A6G3ZXJ5_9BACL|nr:LysR family transcriptional regulator [Paenibacillus sp. SYP-B3998]NEW06768.1 LysR family transcriptional regulator [Paenibacillus sp. SYP-B3998]